MWRAAAILIATIIAQAAVAETAEDLFSQFDLYGTWALQCGKPASPANPHVRVASISAGVLTEEHDIGPQYQVNSYLIATAERLDATRLSVHALFRPGQAAEDGQRIVWQIVDGTRRTIFNQSDSGKILVKDGVALANGARTPLLHKCK